MEAVKEGQLLQCAAAKLYNIPRQTLRDHLRSGKFVKRFGRTAVLNEIEESELVKRITESANAGTTITPKLIRMEAFNYCEEKNKEHRFNQHSGAGRNWLKKFLERHPQLHEILEGKID